MFNNDFMDYMGYRNMIIEAKIKECLEMAKKGVEIISIDTGDLTDDEIKYLEKEVKRRIRNVF